jgi:hypothetical protein
MRIHNNDDYILLDESSGVLDDSEGEEGLDSYNLQHLSKLKYLVVLDADIKPSEIKKLLLYAISHEFHLLALLDRKDSRHRICIEDGSSHMFPPLEAHCRIFRRRMMQCLTLARTAYLSRSFFREEVIEACNPFITDHFA